MELWHVTVSYASVREIVLVLFFSYLDVLLLMLQALMNLESRPDHPKKKPPQRAHVLILAQVYGRKVVRGSMGYRTCFEGWLGVQKRGQCVDGGVEAGLYFSIILVFLDPHIPEISDIRGERMPYAGFAC